jgi:hypothetical protein
MSAMLHFRSQRAGDYIIQALDIAIQTCAGLQAAGSEMERLTISDFHNATSDCGFNVAVDDAFLVPSARKEHYPSRSETRERGWCRCSEIERSTCLSFQRC